MQLEGGAKIEVARIGGAEPTSHVLGRAYYDAWMGRTISASRSPSNPLESWQCPTSMSKLNQEQSRMASDLHRHPTPEPVPGMGPSARGSIEFQAILGKGVPCYWPMVPGGSKTRPLRLSQIAITDFDDPPGSERWASTP